SADGRAIYYVAASAPGQPPSPRRRLVEHVVSSGAERDLYVAPEGVQLGLGYSRFEPNLRLTRDGQSVIFTLGQSPSITPMWVASVPVAGGPARLLTDSASHRSFTNIRLVGLDAEGTHAIFTTRLSGKTPDAFEDISAWTVPLAGGAAKQIAHPSRTVAGAATECPYPCSLSLSPDGRKVAFTSGESRQELWVMDDRSLRSAATNPASARRR
ncbi:MAG TPA: hypothetical protein VLA56_18470, partial [Pseudomonadales bacterium]|nr:hypothetical protein [Pseudomonadales bacterium]